MFPIFYSDAFLEHKTGVFHPERPERLKVVVERLKSQRWAHLLQWETPTPFDRPAVFDSLSQVHPLSYVDRVRRIAERGGGHLDPDTPVSPRTYEVALLAVSAWIDGVDRVVETGKPAFVLARPPGHHATRDRGMGFCIFANEAIAALYGLKHFGIDRVAILDWDVHHGNGTQSIIQTHPQLAYCSLHQSHCYPGTGFEDERGCYNNVLNIPISVGTVSSVYQELFREKALPFLRDFRPDLLIISAGYDALKDDPLAGLYLNPEDYTELTEQCLQITEHILFGLEGGYDLDALAEAVVRTIEPCLIVER
ncbi:histone deacetylase family protein [Baaleninema simplex]|uniref:histone deacetylase family protein n=1 Tax=Baaleninema simplex TaxID=2862350 RepID=UPI000477C411|nr:histone deacetylase [Baaleninema simplex]